MIKFFGKRIWLPALIILLLITIVMSVMAIQIGINAREVYNQKALNQPTDPANMTLANIKNITVINQWSDRDYIITAEPQADFDASLHPTMLICGAASAFIVFFAFAFFCNRKKSDYVMALPYGRKSLLYTGMALSGVISILMDVVATIISASVFTILSGWFPTNVFTGSLLYMMACSVIVTIIGAFAMVSSTSWFGVSAILLSLIPGVVCQYLDAGWLPYRSGYEGHEYQINGIELDVRVMLPAALIAIMILAVVSGIVVSHRNNNDDSASFANPIVGCVSAGVAIAFIAAGQSSVPFILFALFVIGFGPVIAYKFTVGTRLSVKASLACAGAAALTAVILTTGMYRTESLIVQEKYREINSTDVVAVQIDVTGSQYTIPGGVAADELLRINNTEFTNRTLIENVCGLYNLNGHTAATVISGNDKLHIPKMTFQDEMTISFIMENGKTITVYMEINAGERNALIKANKVITDMFLTEPDPNIICGLELCSYGPITQLELDETGDETTVLPSYTNTVAAEIRDNAEVTIKHRTSDPTVYKEFTSKLFALFDQCSEEDKWIIHSLMLPDINTSTKCKNVQTIRVCTTTQSGLCGESEYVVPESLLDQYNALVDEYFSASVDAIH